MLVFAITRRSVPDYAEAVHLAAPQSCPMIPQARSRHDSERRDHEVLLHEEKQDNHRGVGRLMRVVVAGSSPNAARPIRADSRGCYPMLSPAW